MSSRCLTSRALAL
ncbi:Protein of unknown function [Pyronema omphalodes CBS 100304]|uniref:Uncharacterized protein n=1 Tax=Pyronema omphalodes (strain CBS 100304) TaxID=1076935 RepID=U4LDD9_PYROM|nr:Protein of unknown function [Pyronema omphalodes CBS 100304]